MELKYTQVGCNALEAQLPANNYDIIRVVEVLAKGKSIDDVTLVSGSLG